MLGEIYHPNAYLTSIKNMRLGLRARTRILSVMERIAVDAKSIAKDTGMAYGVVMHHLKLLEREGIVNRRGSKPYVWELTGLGQKRLANSV